ncbi:MAG: hypothetical protein JRD47_09420 [Deltaproteobacteria bacterium]|nr:hypothetical protein [Deltaproteobacteria bacterium]MBW2266681.1 hypothetical protein [Deltaproteobacteria bacterium]MBW2602123.1 hypothetical protein [Deltaproteobacteria bacterium]
MPLGESTSYVALSKGSPFNCRDRSRVYSSIGKSLTAVIFINQIRMKIGVMFGNPETNPGGNALKFYSSVRLDIRRIGHIKDGQEVVGSRPRVRVLKNKVAPPFKEAQFDIICGEGISTAGDLLDMAVQEEIVDKSRAWYSFENERIGQGREKVKAFLKENCEIFANILKKVRNALILTGRKTSLLM